MLPPEPVARPPDPDSRRPDFIDAQRAAADALRAIVATGRFFGHAARRRHRLGQDRSLFRGGRRGDPAQTAGADPDAGDRAHRAIPRSLCRSASACGRRNGIPRLRRASARAPGRAVAAGEVPVVVGARSALFLPYADLGLIVVDEEHDPAYKQEDGVHYHARDMAVVRARDAKIPIVLASATPSVETEVNARRGRYRAPASAGAFRRPASAVGRSHRSAARRPAARPLHLAAAGRSGEDRARAQRAGAAVPQPPRLSRR